jgi:hypothetical protein
VEVSFAERCHCACSGSKGLWVVQAKVAGGAFRLRVAGVARGAALPLRVLGEYAVPPEWVCADALAGEVAVLVKHGRRVTIWDGVAAVECPTPILSDATCGAVSVQHSRVAVAEGRELELFNLQGLFKGHLKLPRRVVAVQFLAAGGNCYVATVDDARNLRLWDVALFGVSDDADEFPARGVDNVTAAGGWRKDGALLRSDLPPGGPLCSFVVVEDVVFVGHAGTVTAFVAGDDAACQLLRTLRTGTDDDVGFIDYCPGTQWLLGRTAAGWAVWDLEASEAAPAAQLAAPAAGPCVLPRVECGKDVPDAEQSGWRTAAVTTLALNPGKTMAVAGLADGRVVGWDLRTATLGGPPTFAVQVSTAPICGVFVDARCTGFIACSKGHSIAVWTTEGESEDVAEAGVLWTTATTRLSATGCTLTVHPADAADCMSVASGKDFIVAHMGGGGVAAWQDGDEPSFCAQHVELDEESPEPLDEQALAAKAPRPAPATALAVAGDATAVVTAGRRAAIVWDVRSGALRWYLPHHETVECCALAAAASHVVTATARGVRVWLVGEWDACLRTEVKLDFAPLAARVVSTTEVSVWGREAIVELDLATMDSDTGETELLQCAFMGDSALIETPEGVLRIV